MSDPQYDYLAKIGGVLVPTFEKVKEIYENRYGKQGCAERGIEFLPLKSDADKA